MAGESKTGKDIKTLDSGRLLTPEEASFLEEFLLGSTPVVVVGNERSKHKQEPKKQPKRSA